MRRLLADDVDQLCRGAVLLTAGSDTSSMSAASTWARDSVARAGGIAVRELEEVDDDEHVVTISMVGAPRAMAELLPMGDEPSKAVRLLEKATGWVFDSLIGLNLAGENAAIVAVAAASRGIDLLDADGVGRVFPLLEQTTFSLAGVPVAPLALVGATGNSVVVRAEAGGIEALVRSMLPTLGGWAIAACYPMSGAQVKRSAVPGTLSSVIAAGASRGGTELPAGARVLAHGRVTAVEAVDEGPRRGALSFLVPSQRFSVVVRELATKPRHLRLEAHNEVEVVFVDGIPVASAPDQIHLVVANEGRVIDPSDVLVGDRIDVVTIPADARWHSPEGLELGRTAMRELSALKEMTRG